MLLLHEVLLDDGIVREWGDWNFGYGPGSGTVCTSCIASASTDNCGVLTGGVSSEFVLKRLLLLLLR